MRTLVLGNVNGAYRALEQVLNASSIDYEKDTLIVLGDVGNYYPDTDKVVAHLLKVKNVLPIVGDCDLMIKSWLDDGRNRGNWIVCGGKATEFAYKDYKLVPQRHRQFFSRMSMMLSLNGKAYAHGGFGAPKPWEPTKLAKDWVMWEEAQRSPVSYIEGIKEYFVSHIPQEASHPVVRNNVYNLNLGARLGGRVVLMDAVSKDFWVSEPTQSLYNGLRV